VDAWDLLPATPTPLKEFMANCGEFPNLRVVRGFSPAVAADVPNVDMVFLDGDHEYESVKADILAWNPKARKMLCGHDYGVPPGMEVLRDFPGVKQAVDEVFGDQVSIVDGTCIWAIERTA